MGCPVGFVVVGEPKHRYIQLCRILDAFEDVGCLFGVNIDHRLDIHRLEARVAVKNGRGHGAMLKIGGA